MQRSSHYPALPGRARCIFWAVDNGRRVAIRCTNFDDLIRRLRERCSGGKLRELWEGV